MQFACPAIQISEHTLVTVSISAPSRGQLSLGLTNPWGDYSQLLTRREADTSGEGFVDWTFQTVHFWGTDPNGEFLLLLEHGPKSFGQALLRNVRLTVYGYANKEGIAR